jgi:putative ABC transport system permease protein
LPPAETAIHEKVRAASRALLLLGRGDAAEILSMSLAALGRYKLRTALSVLGVVLGVAAVIAMTSVTEGAREDTLRQVALLGLENIVVRTRGVSLGDGPSRPHRSLSTGDAARLRLLVPLAAAVTPVAERFTEVSGPSGRRTAMLLGIVPEYRDVLGLEVSRGRFLAAPDLQRPAGVCVLGGQLSRALFGFRDPLGDSIRIESGWCRVVGVLADRTAEPRSVGPLTARDLNRAILVPLSSVVGWAPSLESDRDVDEIWIRVREADRIVEIGRVVEHTLRRLHRAAEGFEVVVPRELLNQRYRTQRTFSVVVGSVAALSLLVGGIGIMNIMLASVLERTHEIGVRRTVGATRVDITLQFLVESTLMTVSGGVAGIVVGTAVAWGITAYAGWSTRISAGAVLLALTVSVAVGLAFGIYPARRAAQLDPIEALRYE